ncbi:MAG TPA: decaprenyl-phosphate phosphoribosyltransferase [Bacteroidota bacterium]|nr:decaprenyl-phosphate phosphoribosyltransferase [Bacteroidota bacterium]
MKHFIRLLRPGQYIKNVLVFAPLFFSFSYDNLSMVALSLEAFVCFCIAASGIYVLNDLKDIDEDRRHPEKKDRPLARGDVSTRMAAVLTVVLLTAACALSAIVSLSLCAIVCLYIATNLLYSFGLKRVSILDIVLLSFGFLLRVAAGGAVTGIPVSMWLVIMTFLLAVFLGIAKRREDIRLSEQGLETRKNISHYNLEFINATMVLMAGVIIVSYILYTISPEIQLHFRTRSLYITALFVIVGILRYMQIVFVENGNTNPTDVLYRDRFLQVVIVLWILSFLILPGRI